MARGLSHTCGVGRVGGRSDSLPATAQPRGLVHLGPCVLLLAGGVRTTIRDLRGSHLAWLVALRPGDDLADVLDMVPRNYLDDISAATLLPQRTPRLPRLEMGVQDRRRLRRVGDGSCHGPSGR